MIQRNKNDIYRSLKPHLLAIGLLLTLFASSCVPTKKLVYLQPKGGLKESHVYDSAVAVYSLKKEPYRLKPEDVISLRVASVTEDQYNFIKRYETDLGIIRELNQYSEGNNRGGSGSNQYLRGGIGTSSRGEDSENGGLSAIALDRQNTGFVLDRNGELELPQLGTVKLAGLTLSEAEAKVKEKLLGYFETPMVRIQLLNFHFTVLGEVNEEGRYTSFDPELNIFDAFSIAGNLTEFADRSNIKIIRQDEGGVAKVIYLNTLDEKTLNADNFYLKRDDLIIVPPLEARTTNKYTIPNISRTLGIVSAAISLTALIISLNNR